MPSVTAAGGGAATPKTLGTPPKNTPSAINLPIGCLNTPQTSYHKGRELLDIVRVLKFFQAHIFPPQPGQRGIVNKPSHKLSYEHGNFDARESLFQVLGKEFVDQPAAINRAFLEGFKNF